MQIECSQDLGEPGKAPNSLQEWAGLPLGVSTSRALENKSWTGSIKAYAHPWINYWGKRWEPSASQVNCEPTCDNAEVILTQITELLLDGGRWGENWMRHLWTPLGYEQNLGCREK